METVIHGECIEVMRGMESDSVDAIVTDPPYGLEFMGKEWDKPRPSSARIRPANARDMERGAKQDGLTARLRNKPEAYVAGRLFEAWCCEWATEALRVAKPGAYLLAAGSPRTYHRLASGLEDAGWVLIDCIQHIHGQGFPKGKGQLKPGYEPWTLARKPAPRVLPLQIDACRIEGVVPQVTQGVSAHLYGGGKGFAPNGNQQSNPHASGRWPANVILDESAAAAMDLEVGNRPSTGDHPSDAAPDSIFGKARTQGPLYSDVGGPSRYFYCAKASRSERGEGNNHPTVKPQALLRWMCRLVTPPGGTILDPFAGSGTTLLAARQEGFNVIGIERESEYIDIIHKRLAIPEPPENMQLSLLG